MAFDIIPSAFWRFPADRPFWDGDDDLMPSPAAGGVSISEDDKHVYVEVALPGIDPKDTEITFDRGLVWIKGETRQEEPKRKYYRKALSAFSYRVAVPGELDPTKEPEASCKNGVMTVMFAKSPSTQPKKITVKA
jgi:HSP20 family protein